ncbi:restriction endonuclease subunit S [Acinetobacter junii]|uniref:restriction endonuclease subunit S n=1 Tax=Acinetobacter junii TaxID=40215 RepID=UPI0038622056
MSDWVTVSLNEIAFINPTEKLAKGTLATKIGMDNLQPFSKKVSAQIQENYNGGMKFRNGDTIVARITPCLENGKTAYIDTLKDGEIGFGSTEYIVLRAKVGLSNSHFLYYFARSDTFRDVAIASMTGSSGRQRVQTEVVVNHTFELPTLPEQKAIASVLSSLDDKIDLLHRQNKTLEAMAETLFRQLFIEEAKEDWEELSVSDIAIHIKDNVNPSKDPLKTFYHFSLPAFDSGQKPTSELGSEILSNKYRVSKNSILVSKLNPRVPRIWLVSNVEANYVCSTEFQNLKPKVIAHLMFLYSLFNSRDVIDELTMSASGTSGSHQRVKPEDMLNITFRTPSLDYLEQYSSLIAPSMQKVASNKQQIQTLENLRDTLLPKLMSGEVRVQYQTEEVI